MTHIFLENGEGDSENNLSEAVGQAINNALSHHKFAGDDQCSLSIVIEAHEFDGKKYRVKLRIVIFDHTEAQLDYIHDIEKQRINDTQAENIINSYYLAIINASMFRNNFTANRLLDFVNSYDDIGHIGNISFIATSDVHVQLATDWGYSIENLYSALPNTTVTANSLSRAPSPTSGIGDGKQDKVA